MVFEQHSILQRKLAEDARKKQEQEEEEKKKKAAEEKVQEKARQAAATCSFMQSIADWCERESCWYAWYADLVCLW